MQIVVISETIVSLYAFLDGPFVSNYVPDFLTVFSFVPLSRGCHTSHLLSLNFRSWNLEHFTM